MPDGQSTWTYNAVTGEAATTLPGKWSYYGFMGIVFRSQRAQGERVPEVSMWQSGL
jgi:hypothetical protein